MGYGMGYGGKERRGEKEYVRCFSFDGTVGGKFKYLCDVVQARVRT
jgi:hypothetical protein